MDFENEPNQVAIESHSLAQQASKMLCKEPKHYAHANANSGYYMSIADLGEILSESNLSFVMLDISEHSEINVAWSTVLASTLPYSPLMQATWHP